MTVVQIIIAVVFVWVAVDIYRRIFDIERSIRVLHFFADTINKTWMLKGDVSKDELSEIGKKVLYGRPEKEHERLKRDLLKSGISFDD